MLKYLFVFSAIFLALNTKPTFSADSKIVCKQKCKTNNSNKAILDSCIAKCNKL